LLKLGH